MTERAGTDSLNITYEEVFFYALINSDDNNIKNQLLLKNIPSSELESKTHTVFITKWPKSTPSL